MAPAPRLLVVPGKSPTSLDLSLFIPFLPLAPHWFVLTIKGKDGHELEHPVLVFCSLSTLSIPEQQAVDQKMQPLPGVGKAQSLRAQTLQPDHLPQILLCQRSVTPSK